jgi:preprotein translocase subunit SecF
MRILSVTKIDFLKWRWHAIILSAIVMVAGIATVATRGMSLGIDFTGGTVLVLRFNEPVQADAIRSAIEPVPGDKVVQRMAGSASENQYMVRLPVTSVEQGSNLEQISLQAEELIRAANIGTFTVEKREIVGPVIGADLARKGVYATITALGGILLYITFRFNLMFAVGAIVAVFHDIVLTLVILSWAGYDLTLNIVAAVLTITGYSVNDTIVIFDRVRENQRARRREALSVIINESVNQTLSRTIITTGTTFLSVGALYLFGGEVLRGFAFTMLVGILLGTYSTVFIASAIAVFMGGGRKGSAAPVTQAQAKAQSQARSAPRARKVRA